MTKYIAIFEHALPPTLRELRDNPNTVWRPWINCDPGDKTLPQLAAWQHFRFRGGIGHDDPPLKLFVCIRDSLDLRTPAGLTVNYTEFKFTRQ